MNKRYSILTGILLMVTVITYFLSNDVPAQQKAVYAKQLPVFINGWYGKDIEIDKQTLEILETEDVLMREYKKEQDPPVLLCIVYASNNRKVSHPPEVCYKGSGWSLEEKIPVVFSIKSGEFPEFSAIKLIIEKADQRQLVLYWYKCNSVYATNYYKQQINIVKNQIMTGNSTSGLVRISTPIVNNDEDVAMMRAQRFSLNMLPFITKYLP
jgi:EpsI family protein